MTEVRPKNMLGEMHRYNRTMHIHHAGACRRRLIESMGRSGVALLVVFIGAKACLNTDDHIKVGNMNGGDVG